MGYFSVPKNKTPSITGFYNAGTIQVPAFKTVAHFEIDLKKPDYKENLGH